MKPKEINEWLALVANLGVIAGIIILAIELNQNNRLMMSQTRSEIAQSVSDVLLRTAFSDYAGITLNTVNLDSLDDVDRRRVGAYQYARLRLWENFHYQYRSGLFEQDEFDREREVWRQELEVPVVKLFFCSTRSQFSDLFVAEMDSLMTSGC